MSRSKYSGISTAGELDKALESLHAKIGSQEKKISVAYKSLSSGFTPLGLASGLLRKSPEFFSGAAFVWSILKRFKKKH